MPANRTPGPVDISADPRWGYNPLTRRYIKRSGEIWRRLVKAGVVQDEEVASQLANGAGTKTKYIRGQNVVVQADRDAASRTVADVFDPAKLSNAQLRQIADHISELQLAPKNAQRAQRPAQSLTSKWQDLAAQSTQSVVLAMMMNHRREVLRFVSSARPLGAIVLSFRVVGRVFYPNNWFKNIQAKRCRGVQSHINANRVASIGRYSVEDCGQFTGGKSNTILDKCKFIASAGSPDDPYI
jgi:hypothetical protein